MTDKSVVQVTEPITVTRALAELKHLDKRIKKQIDAGNFIVLITKANKHSINQDDFTRNSKADYQSVTDLVLRYNQIKSAIIQSNAVTKVKLGHRTYSVADVIERRQSLPLTRAILDRLRVQRDLVKRTQEANNSQMEMELQKLLETQFSGTGASKSHSSDIESISNAFRESKKSVILDPLQIDQEIARLTAEIEQFDHEANFVLSESNAMTKLIL